MHIATITWENIHQHGSLWFQSHRLRHQAFVERQHWDIPHFDGVEWDQFDTPRASYIIVDDGTGRCAAVCRLVPTTAPYMLETIFPHLLPYDPPKRADVWEATRIAVDATLTAPLREQALRALIIGVQQFGLNNGINHYLGLMPIPIFRRTLVRNGVRVRILEERARPIDGIATAAGEIAVDVATITRLTPASIVAYAA